MFKDPDGQMQSLTTDLGELQSKARAAAFAGLPMPWDAVPEWLPKLKAIIKAIGGLDERKKELAEEGDGKGKKHRRKALKRVAGAQETGGSMSDDPSSFDPTSASKGAAATLSMRAPAAAVEERNGCHLTPAEAGSAAPPRDVVVAHASDNGTVANGSPTVEAAHGAVLEAQTMDQASLPNPTVAPSQMQLQMEGVGKEREVVLDAQSQLKSQDGIFREPAQQRAPRNLEEQLLAAAGLQLPSLSPEEQVCGSILPRSTLCHCVVPAVANSNF